MRSSSWPAIDVRLGAEPLNIADANSFVTDPTAGGVVIFAGTTRAETTADGRALLALDYEAYHEMAAKQLNALAAEAAGRWPIARLVLWHRVGRVEVKEPSVIIALSTAHRADAFDACRWLIDELKRSTTIWKREVWSGGEPTWVHPTL